MDTKIALLPLLARGITAPSEYYNKAARVCLSGLFLLLASFATPVNADAGPSGLYQTTADNENNAGTGVADNDLNSYVCINAGNHPIEFNIDIPAGLTPSTALLSVQANDVDVEFGEYDEVSLNGHVLGLLSGSNGQTSTSTFTINPAILQDGNNLVEINILNEGWCAEVISGSLLLDFDPASTPGSIATKDIQVNGDVTVIGKQIDVVVDGGTTLVTQNVIYQFEVRDGNGDPIPFLIKTSPIWALATGVSNPYTWRFTVLDACVDLSNATVQVAMYNQSDMALQEIAIRSFAGLFEPPKCLIDTYFDIVPTVEIPDSTNYIVNDLGEYISQSTSEESSSSGGGGAVNPLLFVLGLIYIVRRRRV